MVRPEARPQGHADASLVGQRSAKPCQVYRGWMGREHNSAISVAPPTWPSAEGARYARSWSSNPLVNSQPLRDLGPTIARSRDEQTRFVGCRLASAASQVADREPDVCYSRSRRLGRP